MVAMAIWAFIRQSDTVGIAHEAFDEINALRVEHGLPELLWDEELAGLAVKHSEYMNKTRDFSHSNYNYVENILENSGGYPSGNSVVMPWKHSSGHYFNMLDSDIHSGAIGIVGDYATFLAR